ncbi:MAG: hypothetical protein JWL84_4618 [Rhodospirillales bacterium]|nr:hypothetical protein [Rhodospirillales bacterium]
MTVNGAGRPRSTVGVSGEPLWLLGVLAAVAILPALPFINNFIIAAVVRALIFIALGQAWNVVAGIGGLLSLGHGVFLGIGCYTMGILFNHFGLPPWFGVFAGVALACVVAAAMGALTLRVRGVFFALATVSVSLALVQLSRHFVDLTGGADGLSLKFIGNSLWVGQSRTPTPFLYAGLAVVVLYYFATRMILASSFGLTMMAVRDDETAAAAAGVAVFRTKLFGLVLSAGMTAFAAALYMQFYMAIDPEAAFGLSQAIQLQLPSLLGGIGTAIGPVIGGAIMIFMSEVTNWGSTKIGVEGGDILVYGILLLVVVLRAPQGVAGLFKSAIVR